MRKYLEKVGVEYFDQIIYEYEHVALDWWDSENETAIEIELYEEGDLLTINILFSPLIEGIIERTLVYQAIGNEERLDDNTLVDKKVFENLVKDLSLPYSEEYQAYYTDSLSETKLILNKILALIQKSEPAHIIDLSEADEEDEEEEYEVGSTLDHFIATMVLNAVPFTKENIIDFIELSIKTEGKEYLTDLKQDLHQMESIRLDKLYELTPENIQVLKEVIVNY